MRYYVTSDTHGFFSILIATLTDMGFFHDPLPHKLVICGDLFDRGPEALEMQEFIMELLKKDQVILIRGNHEDLAMNLLVNWQRGGYRQLHHYTNGTMDTVCQLVGSDDLFEGTQSIGSDFLHTPYVQDIIPSMVDYFETDHYIFVHGWIPCEPVSIDSGVMHYEPMPDWRNADRSVWSKARWINGMEAAHHGIIEKDKTIVCGHYHASFGHSRYEGKGVEFDPVDADFSTYYADGIIALDACVKYSKKLNCIIIDD